MFPTNSFFLRNYLLRYLLLILKKQNKTKEDDSFLRNKQFIKSLYSKDNLNINDMKLLKMNIKILPSFGVLKKDTNSSIDSSFTSLDDSFKSSDNNKVQSLPNKVVLSKNIRLSNTISNYKPPSCKINQNSEKNKINNTNEINEYLPSVDELLNDDEKPPVKSFYDNKRKSDEDINTSSHKKRKIF